MGHIANIDTKITHYTNNDINWNILCQQWTSSRKFSFSKEEINSLVYAVNKIIPFAGKNYFFNRDYVKTLYDNLSVIFCFG